MLYLYNTLSKKKEVFKPLTPNKVSLYVCGSTVYDYCHIGHGRIFVCFDVIVRYLRKIGYSVTYVRNITDIDDKIISRALELNETYQTLTERMIKAMHDDTKALNTLDPDYEPRVTDNITSIINLIQILINKGYAYLASNSDVYFDVSKFPSYGALAEQELESLKIGARVDINNLKHSPLDFTLWKSAKANEPFWPSPWGNGRPAWHIECSALAKQYLGPSIDIHGGGADLKFPHHQNEIAQSEAANSCKFADYWLHVGFVQINHEKMSKSLGNFFTIKEILAKFQPEVLRYFYLASHYRSPVNYATDNLESAERALKRLYLSIRGLELTNAPNLENDFNSRFETAMNDDFNTPEAIAVLFDLAREINRCRDNKNLEEASKLGAQLKQLGEILGLLQQNPETYLCAGSDIIKIKQLIEARNLARKNKEWNLADKIRDELLSMQITLEDTPEGTTWRTV